MNINPVDRKNIGQIAGEWDNIALKRHELIVSGKDLSFSHVLLPCILDNIHDCNLNIVVDCGCGTGVLTSKIASKANQVFGVDVSPNSIEIAKKYYLDIDNLIFLNNSIEEFSNENKSIVSLCIANMVLINMLDLEEQLASIYQMLTVDGSFIFTITHPCFWPIYWNYLNEPWFNYSKEIIIEANFKTTLSDDLGLSTHIHRPLNMYINALDKQGFKKIFCYEPYPMATLDTKGYDFSYPRFLLFKCKKC